MGDEQLTYTVPGMSCEHCRMAITEEVDKIEGVESIDVDLESKLVTVRGTGVADASVRAAIGEAGYDVAA
jgi:copper chaperone CopZ